jgi:Protein O-mannosyl-transferase TMEM260-like
MNDFKRLNNLSGWGVFLISLIVYTLTVERTSSFWDCGEFISVSYKLMVPHPPGAPFYLLIGRMFSFLALGNEMHVAFWINMISVLSSAFTVLFTFWTITLLGERLLDLVNKDKTLNQKILLLLAGTVGGLALTFSDTFWFSAGEAEVYAVSSLFTAFAFWAIFRWERIEDEDSRRANRWLIMIAYSMGLSTGIHLLNLLAIPAIGLVIYFKKFKPSTAGVIATLGISGIAILIVLEMVIKGLPSMARFFEILFVNSFGLPFGSGVIFFTLVVAGALAYGVIYSEKKGKYVLNMAILSFIFVVIGFASYGLVAIRSNFNPPINENSPDNVVSFLRYLKREQYGDRPLLKGAIYDASPIRTERGSKMYHKTETGYEVYDYKMSQIYNPKDELLFCRISDRRGDRVDAYKSWMGIKGKRRPNMGDNIEFLWKYQLGWMYWRYFMWNFAGRQNDIQGHGDRFNGNWESGITFIDKMRLGDQSQIPYDLKENKAKNHFYLLPLILGIAGLVFQYRTNRAQFWTVAALFFFTGIAIMLYLNQPPVEPRERDYTSVGSFYAFSIWIGLGVLFLYDFIRKRISKPGIAVAVSALIALTVPLLMGFQNWDDHDRSNRYHSVDQARNLLASCAPNGILFTGGDNDTFPLWYVQEVEGYRTDVRVCVLSYFSIDWYIDQMKRKVYESEPFPITFERENYLSGINDYLQYIKDDRYAKGVDLNRFLNAVKTNSPVIHRQLQGGGSINILPTKRMIMNINKAGIQEQREAGNLIMPEEWYDQIVDRMEWNTKGNHILKSDLMILDIINNNNKAGWPRPVYFNSTSLITSKLDLREYVALEGMAYRLIPIKTPKSQDGRVNPEVMYDNMINDFAFRSMNDPSVYYNDEYEKFALNSRRNFYRLAGSFASKNDTTRATEVIEYCLNALPHEVFPFDIYTAQNLSLIFDLKGSEAGLEIAAKIGDRSIQSLHYFISDGSKPEREVQSHLYMLNMVQNTLNRHGFNEEAKVYSDALTSFSTLGI